MWLQLFIVALAFLAAWLYKLNRDYCVMAFFAKRLKTVDGTPLEHIVPQAKAETIFANVFDYLGADNGQNTKHTYIPTYICTKQQILVIIIIYKIAVVLFDSCRISATTLLKSYVEYGLFTTFYNVITAEDAELLLNDKNLITKGIAYNFLEPFLHTGLLTSTGN